MAALLLAAFGLRIGLIAVTGELGRSHPVDYREYVIAGQRLLETGTILTPMLPDGADLQPSAFMPPLYVALTAGAYGVFGVETVAATTFLQLLNALATTVAVGVVFLAGRSLAGSAAGWVSAGVMAVNPLVVGFTGYIWDTSLFVLATALSVMFSVRLAGRRPRPGPFLAFGAWLGLVALLNPALTLTYPLLVLWPVVCGARAESSGRRLAWLRPGLMCSAAAVLGWLVVIAPWLVRNRVQFGEWSYIRATFMHEVWFGACPEAEDNPRGMFNSRFILRNPQLQAEYERMGEAAWLNQYGALAREAIAEDPIRWLKLSAIRAVDFWAGTVRSHADPRTWHWWPRSPLRLMVAVFASAELVLLIGGLLIRRPPLGLRWLVAVALVFSLTYLLTHIQVRYRTPVEPVLALVAGLVLAGRRRPPDAAGEEAPGPSRFAP